MSSPPGLGVGHFLSQIDGVGKTMQAIVATRHHEIHGANKLNESGSVAEFLTRAMRRVVDEETARFESGLTVWDMQSIHVASLPLAISSQSSSSSMR